MLIGLLFLALLIWMLVTIFRITIVSDWRTRGADGRLRHPMPSEVVGIAGFAPPDDLVPFFEQASFIERGEFQLVDRAHGDARAWDIARFIPLTARDVREALAICHLKQVIPIAWDMEKGVYVVTPEGAVILDRPNVPGRRVQVAANVREFQRFEPRDGPVDDSE